MRKKSKKEKFEAEVPFMILLAYFVQQYIKRYPNIDLLENQSEKMKKYIIKYVDIMLKDDPSLQRNEEMASV